MGDDEIIEHKFYADGSLSIASERLDREAEALMADIRRIEETEIRDPREALERLGWVVSREDGVETFDTSSFHMFSGRWMPERTALLFALARHGFEGSVLVGSLEDDLETRWTMADGSVRVATRVPEQDEDEDEDRDDEPTVSGPTP